MRRRADEAGPMEAVVRDQQEVVWCNGTGARRLFRSRTFRAVDIVESSYVDKYRDEFRLCRDVSRVACQLSQ